MNLYFELSEHILCYPSPRLRLYTPSQLDPAAVEAFIWGVCSFRPVNIVYYDVYQMWYTIGL
jgi:hypothetical protein